MACYLNIGEDHISDVEHPNFEDYFNSKMKIFAQSKIACVSLDTQEKEKVLEASSVCEKRLTFSMEDDCADIYAYDIKKSGNDTIFKVRTPEYTEEITLTIPGLFNVQNALAAIAVCYALNIPKHYIYVGLMKARSSGRMEIYSNSDNRVVVIVDYAHNKLSFEKMYDSVLKEFPGRRIVTVFGCPGKKAFQRRKDLGELSGKYSDMVYITEEDPGEEPLINICEEIAEFVKENYKVSAIYSSDLQRAYRTAECFSEILGLDIIKEEGLREINGGDFQGKKHAELPEIYPEEYGTIWLNHIGKAKCPNGETVRELGERVITTLEKIAKKNKGKTVLISTHATPIRATQCIVETGSVDQMENTPWASNASVTEITYNNGKWELVRASIDDHLKDLKTAFSKYV